MEKLEDEMIMHGIVCKYSSIWRYFFINITLNYKETQWRVMFFSFYRFSTDGIPTPAYGETTEFIHHKHPLSKNKKNCTVVLFVITTIIFAVVCAIGVYNMSK